MDGGSVHQIRDEGGVQRPGCHSKGRVDAVATTVGTNGVSLTTVLHGSNDWASQKGVLVTPTDRDGVGTEVPIVRGEVDVIQINMLRRFNISN